MTLWSVASVLTLAFIFWLNAVMTASPYIVYLSGLKKQSERKNSVAALLLLLASRLVGKASAFNTLVSRLGLVRQS